MTKLHIKHYILFIISYFILFFAEIPGGTLILLLTWQQMGIYLWEKALSKKIQIFCLLNSLFLFPLFFFISAVGSFTFIYLRESNYSLFISSLLINFIVSFIVITLSISFYLEYANNRNLLEIYRLSFLNLKVRKFLFLKLTLLFLMLLFFLKLLPIDYSVVSSFILIMILGKFMANSDQMSSKPASADLVE